MRSRVIRKTNKGVWYWDGIPGNGVLHGVSHQFENNKLEIKSATIAITSDGAGILIVNRKVVPEHFERWRTAREFIERR